MAAPGAESVSVLLAGHEPDVAEMSARYLRRDGLRGPGGTPGVIRMVRGVGSVLDP